MASKLTIHRGSKEIGGSCVEIYTEKVRILIDFGIPLVNENGGQFNQQQIKELTQEDLVKRKILPDIKGLYKAEETEISAIFISHAHPDHFGLLNFINPDIPIYTGEVTKSIIQDIAPILYDTEYNMNHFRTIKNNEVIRINDLSVKAYSADHSIADSLSFEITDGVKTILYSGDFRSHGRKKYLFDKIIKKIGTVDYLLMEGTTLGRSNTEILTEEDLEIQLYKLFKINKLNLVIFSAQNLDRFISVYKACLKSKKTLVIDPYTAYILEKFKPLSKNIPQYDWNNIKIYFAPNRITEKLAETKDLYKYKAQKISIEEILLNPLDYVVKDNHRITSKILELSKFEDIQVIYSLWSGYLESKDYYWHSYKDSLIQIHTSGHASVDSLKTFADKINPAAIIPIHTSYPESYKEIFGNKVLVLQDNQVLKL